MADDFSFPIPDQDSSAAPISFFSEDTDFELSDSQVIIRWIMQVIEEEKQHLQAVQYIFCSDSYLHQINVQHLHHDYFTDIITFPYQEPPIVEADLFISIDRVKDNADQLGVSFPDELHRVMIHGILHLCGYGDKSEDERTEMRAKEDAALDRLARLSLE